MLLTVLVIWLIAVPALTIVGTYLISGVLGHRLRVGHRLRIGRRSHQRPAGVRR